MGSLVLELQQDALNPSSTLLYLLRKAKFVATKLNVQELQKWTELELNGYSNIQLLPQYRYIHSELKAKNPYQGWIPVVIESISESKIPILQPVSELESLMNSQSNLTLKLSPQVQFNLMQLTDSNFEFALHISVSQIHKIIEAARDIILEWAMKLENDGILGEGVTFSTQEKQIAQAAHYTIGTYINNMAQTYSSMSDDHSTNIQAGRDASGIIGGSDINGVVAGGNINGNLTNTFSQHTNSDINEIIKLTELLHQQLTSLPSENQDVAVDSLETLKAEIITPTKPGKLKSALFALWSVGKDVAIFGNAVSAIAERLGIHLIS